MAKKASSAPVFFAGDGYDAGIMAQAGISVAMESDRPAGRKGLPSVMPGAKPSTAVPDEVLYGGAAGDLMPWGAGNDFPQRIVELYNQDPIIPTTLGKLASMLVGKGIMAVEEDIDGDGNDIVRKPTGDAAILAEINKFITSRKFKLYMREMAGDATMFFNGFPEMIVSKDRSEITELHPLNAEECRWCRMTPEGDLPHIWLDANWPRHNTAQAKKINAIDPYRPDPVEWLRSAPFYNCVYPIKFPTPGKRYYSLPHHYALVESGWLDVHLAVPAFKKYMMKNQMTLKYHWKVDKDYWGQMYGDAYNKGTPTAKRAIKIKWLEQMNKMLTDVTRAGNSIITDVTWDQVNKMFKDHITVTPMADVMKDGKYISDNHEASAQIFYALNVDPTLVGFAGGASGARSGGSDKREAYLIALQMLTPFRDMLIEPLMFVAEYNGWKAAIPNLSFRFRDTILTTLDTGAGTAKKLS